MFNALKRVIADNSNPYSWSSHMRRRRYLRFAYLVNLAPEDIILDVGMGGGFALEVFNTTNPIIGLVQARPARDWQAPDNVQFVVADGCALPFRDRAVPVVFSNSVIEHVGSRSNIDRFAGETVRVGQRYYLQTPNKHFPIEPHYLFPFFQYLPEQLQRWMLRHFRLGWFAKGAEFERIVLLSRRDLQLLFPQARIIAEWVGPLRKSFMVVGLTVEDY